AIYGQPELYINEFMADNDNIIADPQGDYDDWIEIYNPVDMNVDLGGFFLTDDLSDPQQWAFPDTFIEAGGFLLVWADDDEGDEGLHTNFKLGADGEAIGLYQPSGEGIDSIVFGEQTTDISYGRLPDGGETWQFFDMPTPGSMNLSTPELNHDVPSPMVLSLVGNYPNPFNPSTTIHYQLSRPADVTVSIYNLMGEQVCIFHSGLQPSGVHQVQWDGSNQQGQSVVSGIYVGRVSTKTENHMMKMVLLK
ncbi:lamin tail domain-containing protein, partial [bacterium]|nr:lamin tail domain-containing protein [bacterium]